jgi:uncharacterized protein
VTESLLIFGLCAGVGALSSVLGVGGGVLLVPIFTQLLQMPIHNAVALSLCCVIATSVTSATKYLNAGLVDLKAVFYLETTTIVGSYAAGSLAGMVSEHVIAIIFATLLVTVAATTLLKNSESSTQATAFRHAYPLAMGASIFAGGLVGLLGVGGGAVKVPILQVFLGKSIKHAVATSTMMLGISAAVGVIPYLSRGEVPATSVSFAALGTIAGAFLGSSFFHKIESMYIKYLFAAILLYTAVSMILKVVRG